ncbi:MAG: hypothetical protein GX085_10205 [Firmicutes bacterium]|nr:hypothetical protein [Bacillota bacterium]
MQLKILDQVFTFKNEVAALEEIFAKINQFLEESGLVLSHLRVDDTEVYTDYYNYLKERIDQINLVEVEVRTVAGILQDALLTAEEYLEQALPEIETLAAEFYQGPSRESWERFQQLLDGVDWLNQLVTVIDQNTTKPERWQDYLAVADRLRDELQNLQEALENRDYVMIGDLLNYEIIPCFQEFRETIKKTKTDEGKNNGLH